MGHIYKIENKLNGKVYIGQTVKTVEKRFNQQKDFDENDSKYIEQMAEKYEIATPYKDTRKYIMLNKKKNNYLIVLKLQ